MGISFIVFILIFGFLVWELAYSLYFLKKGRILSQTNHIKNIKIGNKSKIKLKVLIAGDSIGAGVGASSFETSTAGRIARYISKNNYVALKNVSMNGSGIKNLLTKIPKEKFDLTVIFISSNDVLRFTKLEDFEKNAIKTIQKYSKLTKKLIITGPANVGKAFIVPLILKPIYLYRAPMYALILKNACKKFKNIVYINSIKPPKKLGKYKDSYYSHDKFHPNDSGHKFWFEMVKEFL